MKLKKMTTLALTAALALSLAVPAQAAGWMGYFQDKQTYTEGQFTDVKAADWFAPGAEKMVRLGLMNGTSETTFAPAKNLTAPEVYLLMARLCDIYNGGSGALTGTDWTKVGKDYLDGKGLTVDLHAAADGTVGRSYVVGQLMAILPTYEFWGINQVASIPDVNSSTPYHAETLLLYNAGVLTGGDAYGTFSPDSPITRGELAAILVRVIDPSQRKTFTLEKEEVIWNGMNQSLLSPPQSLTPAYDKFPNLNKFSASLDNPDVAKIDYYGMSLGLLSASKYGGAGLLTVTPKYGDEILPNSSRVVNELEFKGLLPNEENGYQWGFVESYLKDVLSEEDSSGIMKILNEMSDILNKNRNPRGGISDEAKAWRSTQFGKSYKLNEVTFKWGDSSLKDFTITLNK